MFASRLGTVIGIAVLFVGSASVTHAQTPTSGWAEPAIVDNSFLVEEAYNQEAGIVQHISTLTRSASSPRDYVYTLTQEWPFSTEHHQLSYAVPVAFLRSASASGLGDVMFNYRYSVPRLGQRLLIAPRISLIAASGNRDKALGSGAWGTQVNLPVSYRLTETLAAHVNAGATFMPHLSGTLDDGTTVTRAVSSYTVGGSLIGPVTRPVNAVLEYVATNAGLISADGRIRRETQHLINPGMRFALNAGGVQFVPGFSVAVDAAHPSTGTSVLAYFSVEYAFRATKQ